MCADPAWQIKCIIWEFVVACLLLLPRSLHDACPVQPMTAQASTSCYFAMLHSPDDAHQHAGSCGALEGSLIDRH